jgi:predicted alpha/beta hydrolase
MTLPNSAATFSVIDQLTLVADDGYRLAATHYSAQGNLKGNLIMAGATGVQQRFYRRFAEHASKQGFNVLTVDYRGIGESRPTSLKGFEMSYLDWGFRDLAAAVEHMDDGRTPLFWVGHSFGGHALGLLPNHHKITSAYCFGTGAGWAGWMPRLEAFKVRLLCHWVSTKTGGAGVPTPITFSTIPQWLRSPAFMPKSACPASSPMRWMTHGRLLPRETPSSRVIAMLRC